MANHSYVFILLVLFSLAGSCNSNEDEKDKIVVYWEQTKCSDPWGTTENDSQSATKNAMISFLSDNGIDNINLVTFDNALSDGAMTCDACTCLNGIIIEVEINVEYVKKMEKLGFKRK